MKTKIYKLLLNAKKGLFAVALTVFSGTAYSQNTYTYNYTGSVQTITLQAGTYTLETWGADGGINWGNGTTTYSQSGGKGGYSRGTYTLSSTATVYVCAGGLGSNSTSSLNVTAAGGFNGGGYGSANSASGKSSGAGGGGASHIATATGTLGALASSTPAVIIVAGGGGGAGECNYVNSNTQYNSNGGHGGGNSGLQNPSSSYQGRQGQAGTQTAGGGGGDNASATAGPPLQGIFGAGGYNNTTASNTSAGGSGAGGGGGGWYGGGAGWLGSTGFQAGSGGGGSGYIGGVTNGTTIVFGQSGFVTNPDVSGNGFVRITELCSINLYAAGNTNSLNPIICSGQSATLMTNAISNYSWSTGATTSSLVVSPSTSSVYVLTATSPSNCTTSRTISITVSSGLPVLSISNPSNNICLGRTVSLTATGAVTYTWLNPGVVNGQTFTPASTANYTVIGQNGCGTATAVSSITVAPLPVSVLASPTIVCEGYASTLTAVSGVGGYTWQPAGGNTATTVVSPTASTIYTVTASDGTCSGTQTLLLTTKQTPTIIASGSSSMICFGEQVVFTASGGATYNWTPGNLSGSSVTVSPATSTLYTVDGTNSVGCSSSAQLVMLVNHGPTVTVSTNKNVVCTGSPAVLMANGAGSYNWVNGPVTSTYAVNPSATTTYTLLAGHTSNTCITTKTITIAAIIPSVTLPQNTMVCQGGSVALVSGGANTYTWNGIPSGINSVFNAQPLVTSTFTLIANTQSNAVNCPVTHTVMVTVNPNPTVNAVATKTMTCKLQSNTLTASGAVTYSWGTAGSGTSIVVNPSVTTVYTVTGTDVNGCQAVKFIQALVNSCSGISEFGNGSSFLTIFPNPSSGDIVIGSGQEMDLELVNDVGQHIRALKLDEANNFQIKISDLPSGIYFVVGKEGQNRVKEKIVILK